MFLRYFLDFSSIYIAAVIVFGGRIFNNFAIIRRLIIDKLRLHNEVKK